MGRLARIAAAKSQCPFANRRDPVRTEGLYSVSGPMAPGLGRSTTCQCRNSQSYGGQSPIAPATGRANTIRVGVAHHTIFIFGDNVNEFIDNLRARNTNARIVLELINLYMFYIFYYCPRVDVSLVRLFDVFCSYSVFRDPRARAIAITMRT